MNPELTTTSQAIFCQRGQASVESRQVLSPGPNELIVDVKSVGLCRTDLFVFAGQIETEKSPIVPGHEFAGVVSQCGEESSFNRGDRVVVNPIVHCGECLDCKNSDFHLCSYSKLMGVDMDGACAEQAVVPSIRVFRIPDFLTFEEAAFAEPVAATLAMFNAKIEPAEKGVLIGRGRICDLAQRVLTAFGFDQVKVVTPKQAVLLESNQFDFVIETDATTELLETMVRLIRPRGRLVLKSRKRAPVSLCLADVIPKQPVLEFVNYGRFDKAVELLATGQVKVNDLIGEQYPFDQFHEAIELANRSEDRKTFLVPRAI